LGLAAGLSAGIFEEVTRYFIIRFWLKAEKEELLPIKYGIGHGGIEAILVGLVALVAFGQVVALGGEGALEAFEPEQAAMISAQIEDYWAVPREYALLGAWERVSALGLHLGASILVYKSIQESKLVWLVIAVLGHTAMNAYVVIAAPTFDFVLLEGLLFLFAAGWLLWTWNIRPRDPEPADLALKTDPPPLSVVPTSEPVITRDQLEDSRYDE
jgi:uncharacterized membrane protein YhfC